MKSPAGIAPLLIIGALAGVALVLGVGYGGYQLYTTHTTLTSVTQELASTSAELSRTKTDNEDLSVQLASERSAKNNLFAQVESNNGTISNLTKLTQTDKELLQKYSRVYFLNENYVPKELSPIPASYLYDHAKDVQIHTQVLPELTRMLDDAQGLGVPLLVISGYRSFAAQKSLKGGYKLVYGSGSNSFSADQGYSEHQLGTTVDLTTSESGANFNGFSKTRAYTWLIENAYHYGFILSYPSGNSYYQYEPWHWRFVGTDLATKLHEENKHFYDLDQRTIDTFLLNIFK